MFIAPIQTVPDFDTPFNQPARQPKIVPMTPSPYDPWQRDDLCPKIVPMTPSPYDPWQRDDLCPKIVPMTPYKPPCMNPGHMPPSHLYIPPGQPYEHRCPGCGQRSTIYGSAIWC